ncbi:hypothetical protein TNCT_525321 [Trichonephila clavata]|uniref:Uncharacterized protein n=1 Tax=Trichonephila clavata TaxID=2740835 RepID=A0A8X6KWE8_TRICU|nr:hypothetical protein TNCT_525321 [Trichonephila clavata]
MKQSQTFMWCKRFRKGRKSVKEDDYSRHSPISLANDSAKSGSVSEQGPTVKCLDYCAGVCTPKTIIHSILKKDLQMRKNWTTIGSCVKSTL